jgi:hypothetical protein
VEVGRRGPGGGLALGGELIVSSRSACCRSERVVGRGRLREVALLDRVRTEVAQFVEEDVSVEARDMLGKDEEQASVAGIDARLLL